MKAIINLEVTGCKNCPYTRIGRSFGNDGRDGSTVYICTQGAFGGKYDDGFGEFGPSSLPSIPPLKCPILKYDAMERVASKINIKVDALRKILLDEQCELKDV